MAIKGGNFLPHYENKFKARELPGFSSGKGAGSYGNLESWTGLLHFIAFFCSPLLCFVNENILDCSTLQNHIDSH